MTLKRDIIVIRTCCDRCDNRNLSSIPFLLRVSVSGREFLLCELHHKPSAPSDVVCHREGGAFECGIFYFLLFPTRILKSSYPNFTSSRQVPEASIVQMGGRGIPLKVLFLQVV